MTHLKSVSPLSRLSTNLCHKGVDNYECAPFFRAIVISYRVVINNENIFIPHLHSSVCKNEKREQTFYPSKRSMYAGESCHFVAAIVAAAFVVVVAVEDRRSF